ncbi:MAG: DEAD/DEAH box helicase [Armatimonadetes bacterium]|nr:DEAD/DEAH box helicase [Armatimonadota bacterium]
MDMEAFLANLRNADDYRGQLAAVARMPAREPKYGDLTTPVHPRLCEYLATAGIDGLYSHQAAAINEVLEGGHVAVVTSTASGKTLCYNLPILHTQLTSPGKNALYIFPTKALAQDQMRKLREFGLQDGPRFGIYDGDTPTADRRRIRRDCHTILTNPDMLHLGILSNHVHWAEFFRQLSFVVIDEMHTYRGVFGAHVANVIRRLRRICRHYGSVPQFIACSATIGNPDELMNKLTGVKPKVVDEDGSPSGEKWFAFWNPPYIGEGERKSANSEAAALFVKLVRAGVRNITFTKARVVAELICRYAEQSLKDRPDLASRIMAYRGGYTPEQRREIERGMFEGKLIGVTATNALELGVDIGDLDACILTGYPGTIASTWQQAGRAGRGRGSSLAILIALDNPLDQYLVRNPQYLLDGKNEQAILDPHNSYVLAEHLMCAAYEIPISELDLPLFGANADQVLAALQEAGQIQQSGNRWHWTGSGHPAASVKIRSSGGESFLIYDLAHPETPLGSIEEASAYYFLYEGAVYLHLADSYVVERLDIPGRRAHVSRRDVEYYTVARSRTEVNIESESASHPQGSGTLHFGEVVVTSRVSGYWKRQLVTDVTLDTIDLDLPEQSFVTTALWFTLDGRIPADVESRHLGLEGGIHGLEHGLIGMMPLYAMCDRNDIGGASHPIHPQTGLPTIFIYDAHPGGVGISQAAYARADELLQATRRAISECPCPEGCPSCIQSPKCGDNNTPLDKQSALSFLAYLM